MTDRAVSAGPSAYTIFTPEQEADERHDLLARLHRYAHATGAAPGDDVLRHFDGRLRSALEKQEYAARGG
jgi:hypothetical protein